MTDALFDIKYLMDKTGNTSFVGTRVKVPEEYKLTTEYTEGDATYKFYNNPNALGLGMVSSPGIEDVSLSEDNPLKSEHGIQRPRRHNKGIFHKDTCYKQRNGERFYISAH